VESFKEIQDSLCVGQKSKDGCDERVILFVKMAPGTQLSAELTKQIQMSIRNELSARHVPAVILETQDIPYTHSGKKVEVAIKKILNGEDVSVRSAYVNPDSLDLYYNIPQLGNY
jgi:acetoacetyl-CoA synthetase